MSTNKPSQVATALAHHAGVLERPDSPVESPVPPVPEMENALHEKMLQTAMVSLGSFFWFGREGEDGGEVVLRRNVWFVWYWHATNPKFNMYTEHDALEDASEFQKLASFWVFWISTGLISSGYRVTQPFPWRAGSPYNPVDICSETMHTAMHRENGATLVMVPYTYLFNSPQGAL